MASGSKTAVAAAIGGNFLVMIAKFAGAAVTGSGALFSEGIHTLADVLNQILLMVGIVRSEKEADERFQFGYRRERFIWALISAVGIFFLGCGVTIYHGIHGLQDPQLIGDPTVALIILAFALVVEGIVLVIAYKGLKAEAKSKGRPFWAYVRKEADPSAVAVLFEDGAACLGVVIAMVCIFLSKTLGSGIPDAVGSIVIGLLLGALAFWLIQRNKELMVGPSIPKESEDTIRALIEGRDSITGITRFKSRMVDTATYDVTVHVDFKGDVLASRLEPSLAEVYPTIESYEDFEAFAKTFGEQLARTMGSEVDDIEVAIKAAVPEVKFIDIETDR